MAGLQLKGITKKFDDVIAVAKTDLEINDGEFLVLVGPSGCGKSTTLRMIAGLEKPTDGEIFIGDKDVTYLEPKDRDIGMVFQSYALYPHKNVYDNIAFGLLIRKFPKEDIKKRVLEAAEMLEITDYLDRYPKQLSGGQRQRVALARAIARHAQVFLMDEPLSNLDAKLRVQTRAEIIKLHQRLKTTFIYVTHDQTEAMTMGTRIVVMKNGIIQQIGSPTKIYNNPSNVFVAGFVGSPPMNLIQGKLVKDKEGFSFISTNISIPLSLDSASLAENKDVILGIRPESLIVTDVNAKDICFTCQVEVVEHIGAEAIIHTKIDNGEKVTLKVSGYNTLPKFGEVIGAKFDLGSIHIFDKDTELCLVSLNIK
ncbi:MAG: hypothetical protein JM58_10215 [Peptococcaceae bacterium BICA1-8]|nr:MAG: hypothetical protein JM58_10215 [Peptococcaceae bacterium BICA1-8]